MLKGRNIALALAIIFLEMILTFIVTIIGLSAYNENGFETTFPFISFGITILGSLLISYFVASRLISILKLISNKKAFSSQTLKVVGQVKKALLILMILSLGIMPMVYQVADGSDAPGFMFFGFLYLIAATTIYVFSLIVEDLFTSSFKIQHENDLTV